MHDYLRSRSRSSSGRSSGSGINKGGDGDGRGKTRSSYWSLRKGKTTTAAVDFSSSSNSSSRGRKGASGGFILWTRTYRVTLLMMRAVWVLAWALIIVLLFKVVPRLRWCLRKVCALWCHVESSTSASASAVRQQEHSVERRTLH